MAVGLRRISSLTASSTSFASSPGAIPTGRSPACSALSSRTVENHRANLMGKLGLVSQLMGKLGLVSRVELVNYAEEHNLL